MNNRIALPGFERQTIEVQTKRLYDPQLLVNGQPASAGPTRGSMLLHRDDGTQVVATWKSRLIDVPQLVVDGQVVNIAPPLKWYQLVWSGLPILLVFVGGCIGAMAGFTAFSINAQIFRSAANSAIKYAAAAGVSLAAVVAYFILAGVAVGVLGDFGVRR